jgi:saccharopine dehydrogenase-like NADP-dependent oxidoreductase
MTSRVLIIGGYGNFGGYIARNLAGDAGIQLLIAGRSAREASEFAAGLKAVNPAEAHALDIDVDLPATLRRLAPNVVIHTSGPFQSQDYHVAQACIAQGCHYADLADARDFVANIGTLDTQARANDVLVVGGASSVPCLTAAVIDDELPAFARLDSVDYGITTAQQTNRGVATTAAVLSYIGKPLSVLRDGAMKTVYGWEDTHAETYPQLGSRLFGNCDIPDLAIFPRRYPSLKSMRFAAGHELRVLHYGTRLGGALVRLGLIKSLDKYADTLLRIAFLFNRFGSGCSGFHMILDGAGHDGAALRRRFTIVARNGHGAYIPCIPAILLARRWSRNQIPQRGAQPCVDLIDLDSYLDALAGLDIQVIREPAHA